MHIEELEKKLDSFDPQERRDALGRLVELVEAGRIELPEPGSDVNLHYHTFFSYNACGYSPTKIAWLARKAGLAVAGIVDFDVLDGLEEFYEASAVLNLKGCVGIETRVHIPEFFDKVINSPGEPGIAYHIGAGFASRELPDSLKGFARKLRETAAARNKSLVERVNKFLSPVELDYEEDVCPLTPSGNATERHICLAYAKKARRVFADDGELLRFWRAKLGVDVSLPELPAGTGLQAAIRAKTMKRGGIGYVQPDGGAFPRMEEVNSFILSAGGVPTLAWLDGTSEGEKEIEKLLSVAMKTGVAAINIIPDRNYTPGQTDEKLRNLRQVVQLARAMDLPVLVGTEMNRPGQKFVDDFGSAELAPMAATFLDGALILYGHSMLQRECGLGYTSRWAARNFKTIKEKNEFYRQVGALLEPARAKLLKGLGERSTPQQMLEAVGI